MEDTEKDFTDFSWLVIETLSNALKQQKEEGKYDEKAVIAAIDELDLECDRRIVYGEPIEEITELKEVLEDFAEEEE